MLTQYVYHCLAAFARRVAMRIVYTAWASALSVTGRMGNAKASTAEQANTVPTPSCNRFIKDFGGFASGTCKRTEKARSKQLFIVCKACKVLSV